MRIIFVMSEASLWKPVFTQSLLEKLPSTHTVLGAVLTSFKPNKISKIKHIKRYFIMLGLKVFFLMALRGIYHSIKDRIDSIILLKRPHSITGVCRRFNIPVIFSQNVNDKETITWIKQLNPDVILSSGNQIFGKQLLSVPNKGCINRHTSLLPSYGGIYPIFWCLLNDEQEVGVSVHTMEVKIDKGQIIAQKSMYIKPNDTFFSLFEECFKMSVDVVLEAIEKIDSGDWNPIVNDRAPSYYSYPTWKDVREFRRKGKRML